MFEIEFNVSYLNESLSKFCVFEIQTKIALWNIRDNCKIICRIAITCDLFLCESKISVCNLSARKKNTVMLLKDQRISKILKKKIMFLKQMHRDFVLLLFANKQTKTITTI